MESDVNATLSELERKLKELERELETVGRGGEADTEPAQAGWDAPAEPPAGAFTASWHGTSGGASATPPPPPPAFNGAPPIPVTPPPTPWPPAVGGATHAPPPPPAHSTPPQPGLHAQLDELLAFRDRLVATTDDLVAELSRVLTELGVDAPPPHDPADTVLTGPVIVEAGPFPDLSTLQQFEQALMRVPGVAGVHVRTLDAGRATTDVHLASPVALGAALRATAPVAFAVTHAGDGRLVLALAG